jgi:hypothetical protein
MSTVANPHVPEPTHAPAFYPWGRSVAIATLLLLAIAVGLRLHRLGTRSLWYDEAVTANASRDTLPQVIDATRHFSAPMAYPYVLYLVEKVASSPVRLSFNPSASGLFSPTCSRAIAEEQLIVHSLRPGWDVQCVAGTRIEPVKQADPTFDLKQGLSQLSRPILRLI